MIHRIVQAALRQRFLVLMLTGFMMVAGIISFRRMPVDAYPDLSPPQVELITQWPGHAAEEVERLVTLPLELEMNGVPRVVVMRSISLYGLSDVILTFEDSTNDYFARQIVFERMAQATLPAGVTPSMAPLFSPSGLVYRYVLESPDRSPQELKTIEDWVVERAYRSVHGVADDSGFGGTVMQYQVLLDPARIYGYHLTVPQVMTALGANNSNAGGGFYSQGGQFYYVRGIGLVRDTDDIGNIVVGSNNGVPIRIKDIGEVEIGHAPRLGQFGFQKNDDAVEGVILMLRGEQTQNVLKGVEAKTDELNRTILPPDVKIHPFYDRSELVKLTTDTVEDNLLRGMVLVLIVLIFFLVSFRAAIIVALTIPLSLLFAFIVLHAHDGAANLLSIGAIDFGIIIDGTVVMVENIYRELALREGQAYKLHEVILAAAKDVDRPIFYSVAVILAGYLPIYALSGPSAKLFHPMAETMSFALIGALILTLTLVPVLASYWFKSGVREHSNRAFEWMKRKYATQLDWALARPKLTMLIAFLIFGATLLLVPFIGGEFMPHLDEGALWVRATMPYTISFEEASKIAPQIRAILMSYPQVTVVGSELGRPDDGTDPTGFFNCEFYVGLKPYKDKAWAGELEYQSQADRGHQQEAHRISRDRLQLHPARGRCRRRGPDRSEELAGRQDLWQRFERASGQGHPDQERAGQGAGIHRLDGGARTGPAESADRRGPRQDCPLRNQCRRRGSRDFSGRRRTGRDPGHPGRKTVRPGGPHAAAVPQQRPRDWRVAGWHSGRQADSAEPTGRHPPGQRRIVHLSREQLPLHRRAIQH